MTAFARRELKGNFGTLICELRSVNHRYLDVSLRLPEELRSLEGILREKTAAKLARGKLECQLRFQPTTDQTVTLSVDEALAQAVVNTVHHIESFINNPARMTALDLLHWPGVVREPERDLAPVMSQALEIFEATLIELVDSRAREGARIEALIKTRCKAIRNTVDCVRSRRPQVLAAIRDKLKARLAELNIESDPYRLEQELILIAQKLDVEEELDRLDGHLQEVSEVLARHESVGRRLDFLMQEFNREANTLGSKSADLATTRASVELKVLIEQMREQVQNVE